MSAAANRLTKTTWDDVAAQSQPTVCDGSALTYDGLVEASYGFTFNADLTVSTETAVLDGVTKAVSFVYDDDQLLTEAGEEELVRSAATGWVDSTVLPSLSSSAEVVVVYTHNRFAELSRIEAAFVDGTSEPLLTIEYEPEVSSVPYPRDGLGRITRWIESEWFDSDREFDYDALGRLTPQSNTRSKNFVTTTWVFWTRITKSRGSSRSSVALIASAMRSILGRPRAAP